MYEGEIMSENKGILGGIQRFSTEDGPGIRTTLFFKGCPLNCKWCHNPDLISTHIEILHYPKNCIHCGNCLKSCPNGAITVEAGQIKILRDVCRHCGKCAEDCYTGGLKVSGEYHEKDELIGTLLRDNDFYRKTGGGVTFSGGEVTAQTEYAFELEQACIAKKLNVAIDTCGFTKYENLVKLCRDCQVILYDLKCIDSSRHKELTGVGNELILKNLRKLADDPDLHDKVIVRMPLIHPVNDSLEEIEEICDLLSELGLKKVNGIPYHNLGTSKSRGLDQEVIEYETPSDEHLDEISAVFERHGIPFTVMGKN